MEPPAQINLQIDFLKEELMNSDRSLYDISENCRRCDLCDSRTNIVFDNIPIDDRVKRRLPHYSGMIIGEAPGYYEDNIGKPFVGEAGQLLIRALGGLGKEKKHYYVTNIVKCRPPLNREPTDEEKQICGIYLDSQIAEVNPHAILALGKHATGYFLKTMDFSMSKVRGKLIEYNKIKVMPTWHPAYLLRAIGHKEEFWNDLKEFNRLVKDQPVKNTVVDRYD